MLTEYVSLLGTVVTSLVAALGALITLRASRRAAERQGKASEALARLAAERARREAAKRIAEKKSGASDPSNSTSDE